MFYVCFERFLDLEPEWRKKEMRRKNKSFIFTFFSFFLFNSTIGYCPGSVGEGSEMVSMVPKDKLSGHRSLGDLSQIGGYHLHVRIVGFSTRPVVRQQSCLESSEEALLYFDPKKQEKK